MAEARASDEIEAGERFGFGANWLSFLQEVDDDRITSSMADLTAMLEVKTLDGLRFLDAGSGSGLSSLAAHRLGARVTSFDFDPSSVASTVELRARHREPVGGGDWTVLEGSVLDRAFLDTLGEFDVVYSWGVLHHTGAMWTAFENVERLVAPDGALFISIYNDQGMASRWWRRVKRAYNRSGPRGRAVIVLGAEAYFGVRRAPATAYQLLGRAPRPEARPRGMDRRHDLIDWVGGYPFEVAKPDAVFDYFRDRGFRLDRLVTCGGGLGCNQFVFRRT